MVLHLNTYRDCYYIVIYVASLILSKMVMQTFIHVDKVSNHAIEIALRTLTTCTGLRTE